MLSYSRWKFEFESGGKPNLLAVSVSLKALWIDPNALISTHKSQWEIGRVPRYRAHYCLPSNAALLRSRQARARLRLPRTACLTSSSSIDWAKDSMVSFSSTSVVVGGLLLNSVMATLQNQVQGVQDRTPGRPRVLGQAADDFPRTCSLASFWPWSWCTLWRRLAGTSKSHMFQGSGVHLFLEDYF